jgi:hypothetical protein
MVTIFPYAKDSACGNNPVKISMGSPGKRSWSDISIWVIRREFDAAGDCRNQCNLFSAIGKPREPITFIAIRLVTSWLPLFVALAIPWAGGCASTASTESRAAQPKDERASKIAPELIVLHDEYSAHLASKSKNAFRPSNTLLQIVDDRVIIDAVAADETSVLQADLVALGMQNSVTFGRMVSGQLPISSIPKLTSLSSLNFARPAVGLTQKSRPRTVLPRGPGSWSF